MRRSLPSGWMLKGKDLMEQNIWKRILIYGLAIVCFMSACLFLIGRKTLQTHPYEEVYALTEPGNVLALNLEQDQVTQVFVSHSDEISGLFLRFATYGFAMTEGRVEVELLSDSGQVLGSASAVAAQIEDNTDHWFAFEEPVHVERNRQYTLQVHSDVTDKENHFLTIWCIEKVEGCTLSAGGNEADSTLYMKISASRDAQFLLRLLISTGVLMGVILLVVWKGSHDDKKGKVTPLTEMVHIFDKYTFLLKKLVGRDFAVKYRRSYLGLMWVILNPLLTMIVMSSVFSYIFRLQIQNYAVYLILGNIVFGCFSEATQFAVQSIVGSGQLIKKVYMPKYIFPLSKVIFSFINFVLTLIPAIAVIIYYRVPFTVNYLLLPYVLIGLFLFALGIGLFLSALQVFMRDTQYLYGIILTLWTYLTPIFYSEDSLAPILRKLMQLNPMYLYVNCIRKIMLYGITPTVFQLLSCVVIGVLAMVIGMKYFYNKQKYFILHI